MAIELKESFVGKLAPAHLLAFTGNSNLQLYYRDLLKTNYGKGFDKLDLGQCATCHASQTVNDCPRLKPLPKMTHKIHRLLVAQSSGKQLGKYGQHIVKKYLQSRQQMIVKCPKCQSINKMDILSKKDLILWRTQNLMKVENHETDLEPVKKKKRKKKKKAVERVAPNSLLPLCPDELDMPMPSKMNSSDAKKITSNPSQNRKTASLKDLVKTQEKENPSSSVLLQKSLGIKSPALTRGKIKHTNPPTQSEKKRSFSKQKHLKAFLNDSMTDKKSASLSDFLTSL